MNWIAAHYTDVLQIAAAVVAVASMVAALTPSPADDGIVATVRKVIDLLAFNWGNAKNEKP